MVRYWLAKRLFLLLIIISAFICLIYVRRPITEDEILMKLKEGLFIFKQCNFLKMYYMYYYECPNNRFIVFLKIEISYPMEKVTPSEFNKILKVVTQKFSKTWCL